MRIAIDADFRQLYQSGISSVPIDGFHKLASHLKTDTPILITEVFRRCFGATSKWRSRPCHRESSANKRPSLHNHAHRQAEAACCRQESDNPRKHGRHDSFVRSLPAPPSRRIYCYRMSQVAAGSCLLPRSALV